MEQVEPPSSIAEVDLGSRRQAGTPVTRGRHHWKASPLIHFTDQSKALLQSANVKCAEAHGSGELSYEMNYQGSESGCESKTAV